MSGNGNKMTPVALELLVGLFHLGDVATETAARRDAMNYLYRAGLAEFQDVQRPELGYKITERGRGHVQRILALTPADAPGRPQIGPQDAAPRFCWGYWDEKANGGAAPVLTAQQALEEAFGAEPARDTTMCALQTAIFLEALTWDQQARVLARLGWRKV